MSRMPWIASSPPTPRMTAPRIRLVSASATIFMKPLVARIVTELKDKAPAFADVDPALVRLSESVEHRSAPPPVSDAVSGLINLGYAQAQASAAVVAALKQAGEEAEAKTLIRLGLRELAR